MKRLTKIAVILLVSVLLIYVTAQAGRSDVTVKTFEKKSAVEIETVSGDVLIQKGETDEITVEVENRYSPRDSFKPRFRESGHRLKVSERIFESNSGGATWTITVPDDTRLEFSTASGDFSAYDLNAEFDINTASGDVILEKCTGDFELNAASGDIEVIDCSGVFDLGTASGEIDATGVVLEEESNFGTASGSVRVELGKTSEYDFNVGTASGRAQLSYGGNPLQGRFELTAKVRKGRISAPFDFEEEEEFRRHGERYVRKSFTRGGDTPVITVGTASGRAILKE
jgi:DUF4097 and DUF4098 domain-containing protein YvlB